MSTFNDVIDAVRSDLGDIYSDDYAYSTGDMMRYAAQGVREMWKLIPSLQYDPSTGKLYVAADVLPTIEYQTAIPIPVLETYIPALESYVMFRCLSRDVTDSGNAAAARAARRRFYIEMGMIGNPENE